MKMFYPSIMGSTEFKIPITEGIIKEIKTTLPKKKFKYGSPAKRSVLNEIP